MVEGIRKMELSQHFIDLWKKIKVATNATKKNVIIILEEHLQSFSLTNSPKGIVRNGGAFCFAEFKAVIYV